MILLTTYSSTRNSSSRWSNSVLPHAAFDPFSALSFTWKEKDAETGYGYFGARYMEHELMTMWLSVDPMADKYPGISPYVYCAWYPLKLVDPDGRDIVLSESAQAIHEKYYGKKGYEEYTELYDKLNNDHSILVNVKECNDNSYAKSQGANGIVDYSEIQSDQYENGCFDVEWGDPYELHGGSCEHTYFEELFHTGQIQKANYNISAVHTIDSEYEAKVFAAQTSSASYSRTYDDFMNGFYCIPTEMQIINTYDSNHAKEYLKYGIFVEVKDSNNKPYYP